MGTLKYSELTPEILLSVDPLVFIKPLSNVNLKSYILWWFKEDILLKSDFFWENSIFFFKLSNLAEIFFTGDYLS